MKVRIYGIMILSAFLVSMGGNLIWAVEQTEQKLPIRENISAPRPTIPAIVRAVLCWDTGTIADIEAIKASGANIVHTFPNPEGLGWLGTLKPPVAIEKSIKEHWGMEVDQFHEAGIRVFASTGSTALQGEIFKKFGLDPEKFYARDEQGKSRTMLGGSYGGDVYTSCYNNPLWMDIHKKVLMAYARGGFDGMWYDVDGYHDDVVLYCHCEHCQRKWKQYLEQHEEEPDTPLPTKETAQDMGQRINQEHILWRWKCWADNRGEVIRSVKKEFPDFVVGHNMGIPLGQSRTDGIYLHSETNLYDYVHWEEWSHSCAPYSNLCSYFLGQAVGKGKPVMLIQNDVPERNETQHIIYLAEGFASGCAAQDCKGYWKGGKKEITRHFGDFVQANHMYYTGVESGANVAVVVSWWSKAIYEEPRELNYPAYWMGQMLLDMHVPFDFVIAERDLKPEVLAKYQTVILPDLAVMTNDQIKNLRAYLNSGGGIIATYNTGKYDEELRPRAPSALDLMTNRNVNDTVQLEVGKGRLVYFAGYPEREYWDTNVRDFARKDTLNYPVPPPAEVADGMNWVFRGNLPIQVEAKSSTAVILKKQRQDILIHLVNYCTFQKK